MVSLSVAPLDIVTKNHLNVLIQLAQADKHFDAAEREMIFRIGREKNFPEEDVLNLMQNPEPIGTLGALSNNQKLNYLLDCIELVFVDKKVFENELNFCRSIAIKMGLNKNVIDFLIENRKNYGKEELKERVFNEFMA